MLHHDCLIRNQASGSACRRWGVILAGGDGRRLLPLTRRISGDDRPKQFCRLIGDQTLLEQTFGRVSRVIPPGQTLVVLTKPHEPFYSGQIGGIPSDCTLVQPFNRGTAPAIVWSLARARALDPEALVAFFPSDHYFAEDSALAACVDTAFRYARLNPSAVILLGIAPDHPETEYGWIQPGAGVAKISGRAFFQVDSFWEKPSAHLAGSLMRLGCLWNSFIMVGHVDAFLELVSQAVPLLFHSIAALMSHPASIHTVYSRIPDVNFSQAVLMAARPDQLIVVRAEGLGWCDLGQPDRVLSTITRCGLKAAWTSHPAQTLETIEEASA